MIFKRIAMITLVILNYHYTADLNEKHMLCIFKGQIIVIYDT